MTPTAKEKAYKKVMYWKPRDGDVFTFDEVEKILAEQRREIREWCISQKITKRALERFDKCFGGK